MHDKRAMKLHYTVVGEDGNASEDKVMIIENLYSFPDVSRERKAQGCAARAECCSIYSIDVKSLTDHKDT
jgi:hypothetical protein